MKNYQLVTSLGLAGSIALFAVTPSHATEEQPTAQPPAQVSNLTDLKGSRTSAADLLAQTNQAFVQVTGVKINQTDAGIEVILETSADVVIEAETRSEANTFIAEIPNAVLTLPDSKEFQATNPARGIQSVTVTQAENNRLEVRVVGETTVPVVDLQSQLSPTAVEPEEDELEVLVIGDRDRTTSYSAPNAATATGIDTPILETPVSIQVVPQAVIRDQQVTQLEEALRNTSSVTFQGEVAGRGGEFSIRGFEGAPILRDGFREYGTFQSDPEVANLERIEVLKGPASILYGEIQPGGVINLVTKKPLSEPFYEAELQVGSREFFRPRIDLSGPLTSDGRLLYRLNALARTDDGFRDYDQNIQRAFVAPTLSWKVSNNTDLRISLEYLDEDRPADFGISVVEGENEIADVPRDRIITEPDDTIATEYLNVGYDLEHRFSQNWRIRNAFRYSSYDFDYGVIALPTSIDETGELTRFFGSQEGENKSYTLQTNVVGQFATGSITHKLQIGVDLNHSDNNEFSDIDFFTPSTLNIFNPNYGQDAKPDEETLPRFGGRDFSVNRLGVYVQDQISFLENLQLLLGIRYDTIDQKTEAITGFGVQANETNQNDDAFLPRVGLLYQPIPAVSLFGNYSRSFNANSELSNEPLEPERGEGWEVGVKTELFQGRVLATLAYFDITKQNVAVDDSSTEFPLDFVTSGEQRSRGVELDVSGEISPGWQIIASYAYINAEVTKDPSIEENTVGNRLFGIPEHSASLWTTYEIQQGSLQGLGFGVGVNYVGERQGNLENDYQVDSYFIANAAIFYRRDNWRLGINFRNLADVKYIESVQNVRASRNYFGEPFTVVGSFSVQF